MTNISAPKKIENNISKLFSLIGQPARIQILMVLAGQEACVCHLEAVLSMRQASISQHLSALRKGGLVSTIRNGRHIYYHLERTEVVDVLEQAALILDIDPDLLRAVSLRPVPGCNCPQCNPGIDPKLACSNAALS